MIIGVFYVSRKVKMTYNLGHREYTETKHRQTNHNKKVAVP